MFFGGSWWVGLRYGVEAISFKILEEGALSVPEHIIGVTKYHLLKKRCSRGAGTSSKCRESSTVLPSHRNHRA